MGMGKGYFVTGTDTGVGKTRVTCALLHAFAATGKTVVGMKPVAAGCENGMWPDVELLAAASNISVQREHINPYALVPPIAPHIAADRAGIEIDLEVIRQAHLELKKKADIVIVEGAGGFLVPLNDHEDSVALVQALGLAVLLVVGMRLGCINHALLTAHAVRAAQIPLAGWVANRIDPEMAVFKENVLALEQRLDCPLLGILPYDQNHDARDLSSLLDIARIGMSS
ncbi:dethiobiotin synthase [Nitrosospira multiformis]|uniref:ATP-dependent dethiobiotin synthetase BioD n=2 Tax=Nitrosospira multiformis (strain ATCC 25196 / NCIMB 11849 / C 71) TaxID=323848 RepID=BIOD_NITMU|nr:dethiobiotin synthase [Nitrosospira multiformis]Q2Y9Y5.1 RecName: Full=ATP-dependent dethiobiotin synthetase BioD; AltName: Full=DTB synthetase; Short=DTBS; AltName: Full=Dethiobiotin synthase [Nitrosospira multiformis ATCC 25196]ABB74436.1 dethiobiotin synthase [Nitrosospira multiformis ATCC 25196]